jgi:peptidoglycan/LPS O-acetylase OafA/YrhL
VNPPTHTLAPPHSGFKNPFSLTALRRQTSGRAYVAEIDGLRFIAITSVILFHIAIQVLDQPDGALIASILNPVARNGYRGVELFFVISGFILGLPFARHRLTGAAVMRLRDYFLRRVTRLEPPYMVIMLLRGALIIAVLHEPAKTVLPHLLASLGYVHTLIYGQGSTINPPAWSLEVEIQFYCLAPALAWLLFSLRQSTLLRRLLFVSMIVAAGLLQRYYIFGYNPLSLTIVYEGQYFLAGFLLCDFYVVDWQRIPSHYLWDVICLPLWLWTFWWDSSWYHVWLPLACVVLYIGAFKGPAQRRFFCHPLIATTGGMCYSLYLIHNLVLSGTAALFRPMLTGHPPSAALVWLLTVVSTLVVFAVGLVFFVLLERPCMERDWPQKLAARTAAAFQRTSKATP